MPWFPWPFPASSSTRDSSQSLGLASLSWFWPSWASSSPKFPLLSLPWQPSRVICGVIYELSMIITYQNGWSNDILIFIAKAHILCTLMYMVWGPALVISSRAKCQIWERTPVSRGRNLILPLFPNIWSHTILHCTKPIPDTGSLVTKEVPYARYYKKSHEPQETQACARAFPN